jgi:hypothetical protein
MCYEFWREKEMKAEEDAKKKARELIENARRGKPAETRKPAPATAGKLTEKPEEAVPA